MNANLLIDNIVRQTTILIAQLATSGGVRAPLAHIANQVFLELAKELESQGISKQVTADMFGMALRSYRRRVQRLRGSATDRDRSLWEAVLDYLSQNRIVTREQVLKRFFRDDEAQVRSVLHDLSESALLFRLGSGDGAAYRAATTEELSALEQHAAPPDELLWVVIYREGPITSADLAQQLCLKSEELVEPLSRLKGDARINESAAGLLSSANAVMPLTSRASWEAAMFDHFQSVVKTLCSRLAADDETIASGEVGGSTYGFNVWPGHPFEVEVRGALAQFRERHTALRQQVQAYNNQQPLPEQYTRVVVYGGQYLTKHDDSAESNDEV